jgi:hypothetical protein
MRLFSGGKRGDSGARLADWRDTTPVRVRLSRTATRQPREAGRRSGGRREAQRCSSADWQVGCLPVNHLHDGVEILMDQPEGELSGRAPQCRVARGRRA